MINGGIGLHHPPKPIAQNKKTLHPSNKKIGKL